MLIAESPCFSCGEYVKDESFVDFADENDTLIDQEILNDNKHLIVIKSVSKSYGVAGLRLGVLASGNVDLISTLKKDVAIWNINSFAEFYMQIFEKYKSSYAESLKMIRAERERFQNELKQISNIRVISSKANFIMVELKGNVSAKKLTTILLVKYNILVKDLSLKLKNRNYLRFAIRNSKDNDKLLKALKKIFK